MTKCKKRMTDSRFYYRLDMFGRYAGLKTTAGQTFGRGLTRTFNVDALVNKVCEMS